MSYFYSRPSLSPAPPLSLGRCQGRGCSGLRGFTSACLFLFRYVSQPLTFQLVWPLFGRMHFTLLLLIPFCKLCVDSPLRTFFCRFPTLLWSVCSLCRNIRPRCGGGCVLHVSGSPPHCARLVQVARSIASIARHQLTLIWHEHPMSGYSDTRRNVFCKSHHLNTDAIRHRVSIDTGPSLRLRFLYFTVSGHCCSYYRLQHFWE